MDISRRFGGEINREKCAEEGVDRGAWYSVLTGEMFSVSELYAERAWPARSVTAPHGSALYHGSIKVLSRTRRRWSSS